MIEKDLHEFLIKFDAQDRLTLFLEHIKFGTCHFYYRDGKMVAGVRWNINGSGFVAKIEDLYILPNQNSLKIMRYFGKAGHEKFPHVKYIKFDRHFKDNPRSSLVYKVSSLTKE